MDHLVKSELNLRSIKGLQDNPGEKGQGKRFEEGQEVALHDETYAKGDRANLLG
ncbi:Hypothetical protein FKW44_024223 [Caligus rogercresseyi]|uniref:Uncharacterized protein n=1 Tax=Caligus rogercresseyi TaxID=217165 RepID=A0A7T8JTQ8_CALRO|nr:Hypothetical protein FKW44_024223 [Caligus rogercresseyi]